MKKRAILAFAMALGAGSSSLAATEITFLYGLGGPLGERVMEMVAAFNKAQNDVVVRGEHAGNYDLVLTKTLAGIAAGQPAGDVLQLETSLFTRLAAAGHLQDLRTMPGFNNYYNSLWPVFRKMVSAADGGVYASPWNHSVPVLYCNNDLLAKAGVSAPPRTWPEMRDFARKVKAATGVAAFQVPADPWPLEAAMLSQGQAMLAKGRLQVDSAAALNVIQLWQNIYRDGTVIKDTRDAAIGVEFAAGRLACRFASVATRTEILTQAKFKFTSYLLPLYRTASATIGGAVVAIPKAVPAARQQAAWKFVQWLNQPEQQITWLQKTYYLPVARSLVETSAFKTFINSQPGMDAGYRQLTYAAPRPQSPNWPQVQPMINQALDDIYLKNADVKATLKALADRTAPLFADIK
ncbi:MAG TPA: extracellular solute-binding protein [Deinococcales bacterium]|nr:extracellular solute-binding protein [Deinococcales bacterium]